MGTGGLGTSHLCRLERSTVGFTWGRGFGGLGVGLVLGLAIAGGGASTGVAREGSGDAEFCGRLEVSELEGSKLE